MAIRSLEHVNIFTTKLDETVRFYEHVLGLRKGPRPEIGVPGAWIYCGEQAIVHLIEMEPKGPGTGVVDHVALAAEDIVGIIKRAEADKLDYRLQDIPDFKIRQMFLHDPNGVKVELNFRAPADLAADVAVGPLMVS
jgi:catechol 2,3-dioxygenase-like lactoylglutathione lyase family enzyme